VCRNRHTASPSFELPLPLSTRFHQWTSQPFRRPSPRRNAFAGEAPQDSGDDTVLEDHADDPHLGAAARTSHPGKARLKAAAVKIGVDDIFDEGSPEAVALLEALLPDALDLVDQTIQWRLLRLAGSIKADGTCCDQGELLSVSQRGWAFLEFLEPGQKSSVRARNQGLRTCKNQQ